MRQIAENLKFQAVKLTREISNIKKRDQAIQEMIEKEWVQEVAYLIKKSPQSRIATELLKEFKMWPKRTESADEDT